MKDKFFMTKGFRVKCRITPGHMILLITMISTIDDKTRSTLAHNFTPEQNFPQDGQFRRGVINNWSSMIFCHTSQTQLSWSDTCNITFTPTFFQCAEPNQLFILAVPIWSKCHLQFITAYDQIIKISQIELLEWVMWSGFMWNVKFVNNSVCFALTRFKSNSASCIFHTWYQTTTFQSR